MTQYQLPDRPGPTPYRIPEGMMAAVEERVLARAKAPRRPAPVRLALRCTAAAAAVAALVVTAVSYMHSPAPSAADTGGDYLAAFYRLSDEDRSSFIGNYQDDIFLQTYQ